MFGKELHDVGWWLLFRREFHNVGWCGNWDGYVYQSWCSSILWLNNCFLYCCYLLQVLAFSAVGAVFCTVCWRSQNCVARCSQFLVLCGNYAINSSILRNCYLFFRSWVCEDRRFWVCRKRGVPLRGRIQRFSVLRWLLGLGLGSLVKGTFGRQQAMWS